MLGSHFPPVTVNVSQLGFKQMGVGISSIHFPTQNPGLKESRGLSGFLPHSLEFLGLRLSMTEAESFLPFRKRVFFEQRLKRPDPWFSSSTSLGYQFYDNRQWISTLPYGVSQEITIRQALTRNKLNHPLFPSAGSKFFPLSRSCPSTG